MIFKDIWLDIKAVQERDPAARNALEVFLLYQGIHALIWHRFAHWFYNHRMFFVARLISQIARFFTLIEIHPGARPGRGAGPKGQIQPPHPHRRGAGRSAPRRPRRGRGGGQVPPLVEAVRLPLSAGAVLRPRSA